MTFPEVLDALREDGSWRFDRPLNEAVFRLEPRTRERRGALVARLLTEGASAADVDAADPEQWESVLIDALLFHPEAAGLRALELHLTDYHHSARHAAASLAARRRDRLTDLYFGHDFEDLLEDSPTSTGGSIDPLDHHDEGLVGEGTDALWRALPALRSLSVEGAFLFHRVEGEALTELRSRGVVSSDGSVLPGPLPNLRTLVLEVPTDVFGVTCSVEQLAELTAAGYPALRTLDLGGTEFDAGDHGTLAALAESSILPQLERLRVRSLPDDAFAALAPRFAHLELSAAVGAS